MSSGVPMSGNIAREIQEMVEHAAGPDMVNAIREADRRTREMLDRMTDEQVANWILGIEP